MVDQRLYNSSFLTTSKSDFDFYYSTLLLKMSSFANTWNHQRHISIFGDIIFLLESVTWWIYGYNSSSLTISKSDLNFHQFNLGFKMQVFTYTWNHQKKISKFRDIFDCIKVVSLILKVFYGESMDITQLFYVSQNRIWTFISLLCVSKCRLSPILGIIKSVLAYFEIFSFFLEVFLWWIYGSHTRFLTISKSDLDIHYFDLYLKLSYFTYTWDH